MRLCDTDISSTHIQDHTGLTIIFSKPNRCDKMLKAKYTAQCEPRHNGHGVGFQGNKDQVFTWFHIPPKHFPFLQTKTGNICLQPYTKWTGNKKKPFIRFPFYNTSPITTNYCEANLNKSTSIVLCGFHFRVQILWNWIFVKCGFVISDEWFYEIK